MGNMCGGDRKYDGVALSQPMREYLERQYNECDSMGGTEADGNLTIDEIREMLEKEEMRRHAYLEGKSKDKAKEMFDNLDADGNGSVDFEEFKEFRLPQVVKHWHFYCADGRFINPAHLKEDDPEHLVYIRETEVAQEMHVKKEFEVYDSLISKDEKISLEELEKYFTELEQTRHGYAIKMLDRDAVEMQTQLDQRNDGNVSLEEFIETRAKVVCANWDEIKAGEEKGEFVSAASLKGKKAEGKAEDDTDETTAEPTEDKADVDADADANTGKDAEEQAADTPEGENE